MSGRGHQGLLQGSGNSWTPSQIFASGARGAWYDVKDLSTLFQDTAGTVPVTTVGQAVALMKDKSGNGQDIIQPTLANCPVLQNDGSSYYLACDYTKPQWLERTTNNLQPGAQSLMGLAANAGTANAGTVYSRAVLGPGPGRYRLCMATSKADSGAYEYPTSNTDAVTSATITTTTRNVMSQTVDRVSGINKVWYMPSGGAQLTGTAAVDVNSSGITQTYKFRVGAYGNAGDSGPALPWDGRIYGIIIVFPNSIDYSARDQAEAWMMARYGF